MVGLPHFKARVGVVCVERWRRGKEVQISPVAAKLRGRKQLEGAEHRDADGFRVQCLLM